MLVVVVALLLISVENTALISSFCVVGLYTIKHHDSVVTELDFSHVFTVASVQDRDAL